MVSEWYEGVTVSSQWFPGGQRRTPLIDAVPNIYGNYEEA
jgi:hypothetical protein